MAPKPGGRSGSLGRGRQAKPEARSLSRPDRKPSSLVRRTRSPAAAAASDEEEHEPSPGQLRLGPRVDEELLRVIRREALAGSHRDGSVEFVYELIQAGEDVNQRMEDGFTSLANAAAAGDGPLVALLLEKNADVALGSNLGELPLHHAAALGHQVVCQLLSGPALAAGVLDAPSAAGWAPLHLAAAGGHAAAVQALLRGGALVDVRNEVQGSVAPTHVAAQEGMAEALECLLERDADPNAADATGATPLHDATARVREKCVALLLRNRADALRRGGPDDRTPEEMLPPFAKGASFGEARERILRLLSAYGRPAPRRRGDARFDLAEDPALVSAAVGAAPVLAMHIVGDAGYSEEFEVLL